MILRFHAMITWRANDISGERCRRSWFERGGDKSSFALSSVIFNKKRVIREATPGPRPRNGSSVV